ncbi:MAG: HD domain-containing protein [Thermodesulfobacteriota bacterium]|nr:HD domain-containing protein [Thermodesulfobacteriota bacterium]
MILNLNSDWLKNCPAGLLHALSRLAGESGTKLFVVGGAVRDHLSGSLAHDLDIAMASGALSFARRLAADLGGTFVLLDEEEGVARVVWKGFDIDLADFRDQTTSIEADLLKRDFTINAMAFRFPGESGHIEGEIIDPGGGRDDFHHGLVRVISPAAFENDPLRLLRAYRFKATLGFQLEPDTEKWIGEYGHLLSRAAPERISYELQQIMASIRAGSTIFSMVESTLFWYLFPELKKGEGMEQPTSHHLDVFSHCLAALDWMEKLQARAKDFFPGDLAVKISAYLGHEENRVRLKWAALFHDLGKPDCHVIRQGRITFYNHDQAGAQEFEKIGARLHWSREDIKRVSRLIRLHMWPFHLNNSRKKTGITAKACLRLVKAVGDDLAGLFLLAMADSLAGQGVNRPPAMEEELVELYSEVERVCREQVRPVLEQPPLVTGRDLIDLGLTPGPNFKMILSSLENVRVEGGIKTRSQGLAWIESFVAENNLL